MDQTFIDFFFTFLSVCVLRDCWVVVTNIFYIVDMLVDYTIKHKPSTKCTIVVNRDYSGRNGGGIFDSEWWWGWRSIFFTFFGENYEMMVKRDETKKYYVFLGESSNHRVN